MNDPFRFPIILKAQGYTSYRSPEGADGGADIWTAAVQEES